jgi:hypothetical protein
MLGSRRSGVLVAAVVATMGCATLRVNTDYDPQASFGGLRTYSWLDSATVRERLAAANPFLERRMRRAVDKSLRQQGFNHEAGGRVDFLVTALVINEERSGLTRRPPVTVHLGIGYGYPYGFAYPWYRRSYPYWRNPWGYASAYRIGFGYMWLPVYDRPSGRLPGTLVIDVFDGKSRELIWRGTAEGALIGVSRTAESQEYLDATVAKILQKFPPAAR